MTDQPKPVSELLRDDAPILVPFAGRSGIVEYIVPNYETHAHRFPDAVALLERMVNCPDEEECEKLVMDADVYLAALRKEIEP